MRRPLVFEERLLRLELPVPKSRRLTGMTLRFQARALKRELLLLDAFMKGDLVQDVFPQKRRRLAEMP